MNLPHEPHRTGIASKLSIAEDPSPAVNDSPMTLLHLLPSVP